MTAELGCPEWTRPCFSTRPIRTYYCDDCQSQRLYIPTIRALRTMHIDISADENWDTWVVLMIIWRLSNNQRASALWHNGFLAAINPAYCFFNHSCERNGTYVSISEDSMVTIIAGKPIMKGSEIFISYLEHDKLRLVSWRILQKWRQESQMRERETWIKQLHDRICTCTELHTYKMTNPIFLSLLLKPWKMEGYL